MAEVRYSNLKNAVAQARKVEKNPPKKVRDKKRAYLVRMMQDAGINKMAAKLLEILDELAKTKKITDVEFTFVDLCDAFNLDHEDVCAYRRRGQDINDFFPPEAIAEAACDLSKLTVFLNDSRRDGDEGDFSYMISLTPYAPSAT